MALLFKWGARIGVCICPQDALSTEDALRAADTAMHKAKEIETSSVQFYLEGMKEKILYEIEDILLGV